MWGWAYDLVQERKLLEEIKNVFIVNLQFAFQDDENLFMYVSSFGGRGRGDS